MADRTARAPAGRVTQVFRKAAERQAAYDFLEHDSVDAMRVGEALFETTAKASHGLERVFIAIDGTSISLTDDARSKKFGHIGSLRQHGQGLKLINAIAMTTNGTPIGVAAQLWWSRHGVASSGYRTVDDRESKHWRDATEQIIRRYGEYAQRTKVHFLADREADASLLLRKLMAANCEFTVRSNATRRVAVGAKRCDVRRVLAQQPPIARMTVELQETASQNARTATLDIRALKMPIVWRDRWRKNSRKTQPITVVWARERSSSPTRLEWFLYTNVAIGTACDACEAVRRYTLRWRIEDFHKTWKSGACRVEDTQLRSTNAVIKWATILAAVAARIERLRRLSRECPDTPATIEFSEAEIETLVYLREAHVGNDVSGDGLSISQATRWLADLGGYVGARGSGLPGATTISRGLDQLAVGASLVARLKKAGHLR